MPEITSREPAVTGAVCPLHDEGIPPGCAEGPDCVCGEALSAGAEILTPTCQESEVATAVIVAALEAAWAAIRAHHPEVPAAVVVLGPGTTGRVAVWGHFAVLRWQAGEDQLPEVLVSGEGLNRSPVEVLGTLLHEAAHALAAVRGIKDTSRQGRWHNKRFAALANELGLEVGKADKVGYAVTTATAVVADVYAKPLAVLAGVMNLYRHPEITISSTGAKSNNGVVAECACPRKLRVSPAVYAEGPIVCGVCAEPFTADEDTDTDEGPEGAAGGEWS